MAAPPKPWERNIGVNQRQPSFLPDQTNNFQSTLMSNINGGGGGGQIQPVAPPPLPPAPSGMNNYSMGRPAYSSYGSYGGGGYGSYGATSMYGGGGYGNFGGYNRFGMGGMGGMPTHPIDNGFIQLAEESSRPAFQSIESIVHAFGSVSMMLESTYHAVHSSFRAVLGVAEHFTRMKSQFAQIFSAFAVVRTLRWLYKKLLYLIGLRMQNPSMDDVWRSAAGSSAASSLSGEITEADLKASKSSWPILMFFAVVFGGPYLIWRLLSSITPAAAAKSKSWLTGQGEHYAATAAYDFKGRSKNELGFQRGQPLILAPKDQQPSVRGWLLASDGKRSGLVPANYIKILGLRKPKAPNSVADSGYRGQQMDVNSSTGVIGAGLPVGGVQPEGRLVAPGIPGIPRGGHGQPSGPSQATQQRLSSQPPTTRQSTSQPTTISSSDSSNTLLTNTTQPSKIHIEPQRITPNTQAVNSASQISQTTTSIGSVPSRSPPIFDISSPSSSPEGGDASVVNSMSCDYGSITNGNDNTTPSLSQDVATQLGNSPSGINTNG